jgi:hypothetical protein
MILVDLHQASERPARAAAGHARVGALPTRHTAPSQSLPVLFAPSQQNELGDDSADVELFNQTIKTVKFPDRQVRDELDYRRRFADSPQQVREPAYVWKPNGFVELQIYKFAYAVHCGKPDYVAMRQDCATPALITG